MNVERPFGPANRVLRTLSRAQVFGVAVLAIVIIGIPDYLRARVWDPLYTTTNDGAEENPLGSGLGLGLSVVRDVVRKLHGTIRLLDAPPPGYSTAFRVALPLTVPAP